MVPYLDQFRWRGIPLDDSTSKKQFLWDWLLNGLELGRVRQTLRKFPVHDGIVPAAVPEVEVWAFMEASSSDGVVDKFENETKINTFDNRYSPGYVLPLILGALENCLEENTAQETKKPLSCSETAEERNPKNEMLARVSQRLSDKGAVALALGALCSECKSVRQMAVSILGFFIRAAETEEARDISSWRERPQLTMLLHSVHRSLAIRRSVLFSEAKNEGQDLSKSHAWEVPQFSGFSALFLAHASLILARPGDNMYAAVNRFFLSIDSDHGAYQDMNRLPAFISMFCSSSDEPAGQARVERLWALELFKDGFLSEHCFRMAAACHAPELLLTSLNNVRMRSMTSNLKYQEEECLLIIEAIAQMVRRGGRNAAHSLFSRMGLLSWLRSLLVSDQLLEIVPATACRVALLELVSMAVSQAARYETINALSDDTPLLSEETAGLVQPTIQLCLSSIKHIQSLLNQKKSDSLLEDEKKSTLLVSSYDALSSLKASFQLIQKQRKRDDIHIRKHGMDLSSALKFLSLVSLSPQLDRRDVLGVLLSFPLCTDSDKNTALEFSEKILEVLGQGAFVDVSEEWVQNALERIHSILLVFMQRGSTDNACISSFVQKLLDCRTRCFQWRTCRALWLECLGEACRDGDGDEIMSEEAVTGSSAVSLAREILRNSRGLAM